MRLFCRGVETDVGKEPIPQKRSRIFCTPWLHYQCMKQRTVESYQQRLQQVLRAMEARLDEPYSLNELATLAGFSPFHFHRIFRGMVGESVKQYERRLRLERAARQLKANNRTVLEIALDAGYESHEAFTRAFAEMFDTPPSGYRKSFSLSGELEQSQSSQSTFHIERMEAMHVLCLRHVGPYAEVGQTWQRLYAWAGQNGLLRNSAQSMAVCHDDPEVTPAEKVRCDCCLILNRPVCMEGELFQQTIAARDYAVALHTGAYAQVNSIYAELAGQWIPAAGREIANQPSIEFYLNRPGDTPEDQLQTMVCLPLEE
jgi:AraC family transcriptional regulator